MRFAVLAGLCNVLAGCGSGVRDDPYPQLQPIDAILAEADAAFGDDPGAASP
jgi:hypothetical protein